MSIPCTKVSSAPRLRSFLPRSHRPHTFSLAPPPPSNLLALRGFQCLNKSQSSPWKRHAQPSEGNSAPLADTETKVVSQEGDAPVENIVPDELAISAFMSQVTDLIKLVDSRDIVELQLKQLDCEVVIKKKEALQQPAPAVPVVAMPTPMPHAMLPAPPPPAPAASLSPAPASAKSLAPAPAPASGPPAKTGHSSQTALKCPMAGTFYRSPAPGEPAFVKVGDKVQKGQVICIIEAMKLMNEIESDQTGTIAEILVEDGKSVSVDTPLFVIVP